MSSFTRRETLGLFAGAGAAALLPRVAGAASAGTLAPLPSRRPTMLVRFLLTGGMDAIFTTDPKVRGEVEPRIDLPYTADQIVVRGGRRLGPVWAPLAPWLDRMAILNGVQCSTVSHPQGEAQAVMMKRLSRSGRSGTLGLTGVVGRHVPRPAPLDEVWFMASPLSNRDLYPVDRALVFQSWNDGETDLARLLALVRDGERRRSYLRILGGELSACGEGPGCMPLAVSRAVLQALPEESLPALGAPPPPLPGTPESWSGLVEFGNARWPKLIRDLVFTLRHRLTTSAFVTVPLSAFDTHMFNQVGQNVVGASFVAGFRQLLEAIEQATTVDGRPLREEVGFILSSELGRFPILNQGQGKDHFPELPVVLLGPGVRPGTYGRTDADMLATPVSVPTGHCTNKGGSCVPSLEDVGATVLHWFGVKDPESLGHLGMQLPFLLTL